jgi:GntR family transcriptional repressor for pyruvate dehydrogenase complex
MIVRNVSGDSLLNPIAEALVRERHHIEELLEVRHMIEPGLAARAAVHCRSEQLAALELILQRQQEKVCRGNLPVEDDIEFHYVIARAADNSVLLKIYEILMEQLRKMRERSLQVRGREKISFLGHRRIMEALRSRDSHAADLAMRRHLQEIGNVILRGAR